MWKIWKLVDMKPPQICLSTNDTQQADHFLDTPGLLQLFLLLLDFLAAIAPQTQRQQLGPFHQQLGRQPCLPPEEHGIASGKQKGQQQSPLPVAISTGWFDTDFIRWVEQETPIIGGKKHGFL